MSIFIVWGVKFGFAQSRDKSLCHKVDYMGKASTYKQLLDSEKKKKQI